MAKEEVTIFALVTHNQDVYQGLTSNARFWNKLGLKPIKHESSHGRWYGRDQKHGPWMLMPVSTLNNIKRYSNIRPIYVGYWDQLPDIWEIKNHITKDRIERQAWDEVDVYL